jgi:hypothetical protein
MSLIETTIPINACLKVLWVDYCFPYLIVLLAAANGGSRLMVTIETPAVERSVFAAADDWVGQVISASQDLVEGVGYAFLPCSA